MSAKIDVPVLNPRPARDIERNRLIGVAVAVEVEHISRNGRVVSRVPTGRIGRKPQVIIESSDLAVRPVRVEETRILSRVADPTEPTAPTLDA